MFAKVQYIREVEVHFKFSNTGVIISAYLFKGNLVKNVYVRMLEKNNIETICL